MWLICAASALFLADAVLKQWIRRLHRQGKLPYTSVRGMVRIGYVKNPGLFLGAGKSHPRLTQLLPAAAILLMCALVPQLTGSGSLAYFGYGLALGGGINNCLDRILHGFVTDYVNFPRAGKLRRLFFNGSDFGIMLGFLLYLFF